MDETNKQLMDALAQASATQSLDARRQAGLNASTVASSSYVDYNLQSYPFGNLYYSYPICTHVPLSPDEELILNAVRRSPKVQAAVLRVALDEVLRLLK